MIKFEKTDVHGFEAAIRGMRNSWDSWDKSDSHGCYTACGTPCEYPMSYCIGKNDLELMQKLVRSGSDHSKFMRMIDVSVDITAPLYWWKQFDQYRIGVTTNSTSTMHCVADKEFELDDFSHEHLFDGDDVLKTVIGFLNHYRNEYLKTKDKRCWWQIIQMLPSSYNQKRTVHLNYQVLRDIYFPRRIHKLDEWREFGKWTEELPYGKELICVW